MFDKVCFVFDISGVIQELHIYMDRVAFDCLNIATVYF